MIKNHRRDLILTFDLLKSIIISSFSVCMFYVLISSFVLYGQTGVVYDDLSFKSKILKMERQYAVYLPPDYHLSSRQYPVLYLLHGYSDDQTGWIQFGEVKHITDKAIADGSATSMVIVMPDADTGVIGYINTIDGQWLYEDFFFKELIPHIEKTFKVKSEKDYRAIAGLSMGGGGSLLYALHHPEYFVACAPLSAWLGPSTIEELELALQNTNLDYKPEDLEPYFNHYNALAYIDGKTKEELSQVSYYIDNGDDDYLYEGNALLHIALRKKGVPHEFRIRNGGHSWTYWRESLPDVLHFVSQRFRRF
ncbi:MAG: alpha/beta hydrolase-fold protein [Flavobacteriaceae bacterium]|nr:alpha/beta hydrolase-fold protein [Flavobacteriaceae bacterium]